MDVSSLPEERMYLGAAACLLTVLFSFVRLLLLLLFFNRRVRRTSNGGEIARAPVARIRGDLRDAWP